MRLIISKQANNGSGLKERDDEDDCTTRTVYIGSTAISAAESGRAAGKRYYNALAPRCRDQRFLIGRSPPRMRRADFRIYM